MSYRVPFSMHHQRLASQNLPALQQDGIQDANAKPLGTARSSAGVGIKEAAWVCALAEGAGTEEVLSAASMHQHPLLKRDHMVQALCKQKLAVSVDFLNHVPRTCYAQSHKQTAIISILLRSTSAVHLLSKSSLVCWVSRCACLPLRLHKAVIIHPILPCLATAYMLHLMLHSICPPSESAAVRMQFSALHRHEMVEDLICFYNADSRSLSYVIQLGSDVCGYPKIVHGAFILTSMLCQPIVCCSYRCT